MLPSPGKIYFDIGSAFQLNFHVSSLCQNIGPKSMGELCKYLSQQSNLKIFHALWNIIDDFIAKMQIHYSRKDLELWADKNS